MELLVFIQVVSVPDSANWLIELGKQGILVLTLGFFLWVVWREYLKERSANNALHDAIRKDNIENIKVIDGLTNTLRNRSDNDQKLLAMVTETLQLLKAHYLDGLK